MIRKHPHQTGFTLVEMAIVLAILGIILGGLFAGTSALRETSKFKEDQQKLQDIKAALLSYVAVNHYLPCPDTSGDGIENPHDFSQAQCNATSGNLPHLSLGTHAVNAYGLPFSYYINTSANDANSVTDPGTSASYFGRMNCNPNTTNQTSAPCFNKDTPPTSASSGMGNFDISDGSSSIAIEIPLVVISHGQNGCNGVTGREADNCTSNAATYYQAPQNREGPNAFDDVLIWLSSLEIKHA
ncbi:MAG: type II secretion system protein, partial [Thiomicrospira sp.]|uniref:type II secretion system protein n=1 Tax=Thiomicrospira sp. TaxID=935 RepID=UPI0019D999AD